MASPPEPPDLPPLTRSGCSRSEDVERQIRDAVALATDELANRLAVRDHTADGFVQEEVLAFLVRHGRAQDDEVRLRIASNTLVVRITGRIKRWLRSGGFVKGTPAFDDAFQDVIGAVFAGIRPESRGKPVGGLLDLDSDLSDYAQNLFWPFLDARTVDVLRKAGRTREQERASDEIDDVAGHGRAAEGKKAQDPEGGWHTIEAAPSPLSHSESAFDTKVLHRAIGRLPNQPRPLRDVAQLRHIHGLQIEDKDPAADTISARYGKTPKTVRNWLREAEHLLTTHLNPS